MNILQSLVDDAMKKKQQLQQQAGRVVHQAGADINPFDGPKAVTPPPIQLPRFSPVAQQRIMARNPSTGAQQIAQGPVMPNMNNGPHFNPITAGISSAGNAVKGLAEGLIQTPAYFAKTDIIDPIRETSAQLSHNQVAQRRAITSSDQNLGLGPQGTSLGSGVRRLAGNSAQLGLMAATAPVGGVIGRSFESVGSNVVPQLVTKTLASAGTGAITGAPLNAINYLTNAPEVTAKGTLQAGYQGAQAGAVLGGIVPVSTKLVSKAPAAIRATPGAARAVVNTTKQFPDTIAHQQLIKTDPYYRTHYEQAQQLQQLHDRNAANGLADTNHTQVQLQKQIADSSAKTADMRQAMLANAKQKVVDFAQEHPVGMTSGAVNDAGERIGLNGKPVKSGSSFKHDPSQATFKGLQRSKEFPNSYHPAKLGDVLDYPVLFKKYPELKDYTVKYQGPDDFIDGLVKGHTRPSTKEIAINRDVPDSEKLSVLMHEVQHTIQLAEGRGTGGSSIHKLGKHEYHNNPIEVEARQVGEQYKAKPAVATPAKPAPVLLGAVVPKQLPKALETGAVSQPKPKTGVVDKQLQEIQKAHKDVIKYTADEIQQAAKPQGGIIDQIGKHGIYVGKDGLPEDYRDLPVHLRSTDPNKPTLDTVATNLGFHNEDELIKAIQENAASKPMTRAEALAEAEKQLESGKHPYSGDYQQIKDALNKRTDELAQYPNGKYRQVKVTSKPQTMSDAELQSLSQTAEGRVPKQTNKVLERNDKKAIRNADAERTTQDMLKKGATTDEVLHAYMKATGTDLQTAVRDVRRVAKESNIGFAGGKNPLEGTVKVPQAHDADQAFLNADYVKQHEQRVGKEALDAFHNLSDHDKTLLQNIETDTVPNVAKQANNPEAFSTAENAIRTYYDTRHAYDKYLGIDVGYRQNYLRQLFDKAKDTIATTEQMPIKGGNKRPGYTQERSFDTLHTEVGNALERDINGASSNHAKLAYAKGLHEAFPDQINDSGTLVRDSTGNHLQLTNRYGQGLTAQKDLANQLNRRSWTPDTNKALMAYDKVNAGLKYVKLGGGAFHALTEAGNFVGQQIASGKIFKNPTASGKVLKTFFSPKTMNKEMTGFRTNGTLDNAALSGLKVQAHEILADANVKLGGKLSKYSGIQALHDATFQREIPYAKLKLFEQHTEGLDPHKPADLKQMRSVAAGINDLFGGINRDISGSITPGAFKRLQRVVLATDFTESKIRTAFRGVNVTDTSPAAKLARQAIIGKVVLFAGLAAAGGAVGGEFNGKDAKQTAQNILGKLVDPSFTFGKYKVGLPATHVSEFTKPISPLFRTDGGDRFSGLQHYATNRLAAVPSEGLQIRSNKDSSGSRIYGKDYKANGGKPISPVQTAINIGKGVVPIPAAQGVDVARGKTPLAGAVANTIGLRVSDPGSFTKQTPSTATNTTNQIKTGFNTPEGEKFMALSDTEKRTAAQSDPNVRALYDQYQAMKKGLTPSTDLRAVDLSPESAKTLDRMDHLTSAAKDKLYARQPDAEYQYQLAKYENDKKSGTLSRTEDIRRQQDLAKSKVGTQFSKDTRDTYGLSKQEVYDLITQDPDGNKIAQDLLAYGDALEQSGLGKNKFRTSKGAVKFNTASSSGGGSNSEISKMLAAFKTPYSDLVKSSTKGAQLARSAGLAKRSS